MDSDIKPSKISTRFRNYFLTGLVIAAPLGITIYITWTFVNYVDSWVKPLIPSRYSPDSYLPFTVPGIGLVVSFVIITMLGFFTANLVGRSIIAYGETLLGRMPLVRGIYGALKQIFETALANRSDLFRSVGLIEYPRSGLWSLVFISSITSGILQKELAQASGDDETFGVFLPTTPNPTSGYLLFVPKKDIKVLDMTVEAAAKLIISAGIVYSEQDTKDIKSSLGVKNDKL